MNDLISRQDAIDALNEYFARIGKLKRRGLTKGEKAISLDTVGVIKTLPSAEPERLTDDDFETIRLHLNAQKEKLCNQRRWEEAEEYQRIIDRLMTFASAESEQWETCFDCPLSNGCPVINGCTNEQAMEYAGEIPDNCPLNKKPVKSDASDRNVGKWIESDSILIVQMGENTMRLPAMECSKCHKPHIKGYGADFCPNCGADMRGEQDDSV